MRNDMILIASADAAWGIGCDNALLQPVPEDLQRFSRLTRGNAVICGRRTLETFKDGKPLPNRTNIILTRNPAFAVDGALVAHDFEELARIVDGLECRVFVIGGESIYRQLLDHCSEADITRLDGRWPADAALPDLDSHPGWTRTGEEDWQTSRVGVRYRYVTYARSAKPAPESVG